MFELTPLAIALQGIGYASQLAALQGLVAVTAVPGDPADAEPASGSHAAPKPRRHAVRWRSMAAVPAPWEQFAEQSRDEDELLALGVL